MDEWKSERVDEAVCGCSIAVFDRNQNILRKEEKREKKRNSTKRVREEGAVRGFQGEKKYALTLKPERRPKKGAGHL